MTPPPMAELFGQAVEEARRRRRVDRAPGTSSSSAISPGVYSSRCRSTPRHAGRDRATARAAATSSDQAAGAGGERLALGLLGHLTTKGPGPRPVDRPVDHDPMQPGAERTPAIEAMKRPDGSQERLLSYVLGRRGVVDDQKGRAMGTRPMGAKQGLHRLVRAGLRAAHPGALATPRGQLAAHRPEAGRRGEIDCRCARQGSHHPPPWALIRPLGRRGPTRRVSARVERGAGARKRRGGLRPGGELGRAAAAQRQGAVHGTRVGQALGRPARRHRAWRSSHLLRRSARPGRRRGYSRRDRAPRGRTSRGPSEARPTPTAAGSHRAARGAGVHSAVCCARGRSPGRAGTSGGPRLWRRGPRGRPSPPPC